MASPYTAQFRRSVVDAWRVSNQPLKRFAASFGLSPCTVRTWSRAANDSARAKPGSGLRFARVVAKSRAQSPIDSLLGGALSAEPEASDSLVASGAITLVLGSIRIVVEQGFDPDLLREVVSALSEASR